MQSERNVFVVSRASSMQGGGGGGGTPKEKPMVPWLRSKEP